MTILAGDAVVVPISSLIQPPQSRMYRQLDSSHVKTLTEEIRKFPTTKPLILGLITMKKEHVTLKDVKEGIYEIEVIGGNHTRQVVQTLNQEDPDIPYYNTWPIRLYAGLSDHQALAKGYHHNRQHETMRMVTYDEEVRFFHHQLSITLEEAKLLNADGTHPLKIPRADITKWKKRLMAIKGYVVSAHLDN